MRTSALGALTVCLAVAACGGGGASNSGTPTTPVVPAGPAAVASVGVSAAATSVLAGVTVQITVVVKDAQGNILSGRPVTYSSSNTATATVNAAGLVTTLAPGSATITATSEGVSGTTAIESVDPRNIPVFNRPFTAEFPVANFLDHDIPKEFVDVNGVFTSFWGEVHPGTGRMVDGHSGYDFVMPTGTPLFAVAAGRVVIAQSGSPPFFCPPLNRNVSDQADVYIEHLLPGGVTVQSRYSHISRIDVVVGQQVTQGQQVALSGNTGCTSTPHLHFQVDRMSQTKTGARTQIDMYGWTGSAADPWELASDGATSVQMWKPGQAPKLWREVTLPLPATAIAAAVVTKLVFEGVNDATNPNNEFVELTLDTRFAQTAPLVGYSLRNDVAALNFAFPAGTTLTAAQPTLRVFTGSGTNTATDMYMGRTSGVWANSAADCLRLVAPNGAQYRLNYSGGC